MEARVPESVLRVHYDDYVSKNESNPDLQTFREWRWRNCSECKMIGQMIYGDDPKLIIKGFRLEERHDVETHITAPPKKSHVGNGKPQGIFAGTLTMSDKDDTNENEMCIAITKIMTQKTVPVKKYAWYLEYTKNELPHIHFIYATESGGRIHQKIFKRYWKTWDESKPIGNGHRGGYHRLAESETAYTEYIAKDGGRGLNKWA